MMAIGCYAFSDAGMNMAMGTRKKGIASYGEGLTVISKELEGKLEYPR